jgi:drug/metabolite transporter (DMT)-like permease
LAARSSTADSTTSETAALALLAGMVLAWGVNWPVMKTALGYMPPLWLAAARAATTTALLFAALAIAGRLRVPDRRDWPALVSVGVFLMALTPALSHTGLVFTESGRAALLSFMSPLWVAPAAIVLLGERVSALKLAGLGAALAGLVVLFNPAGFDWRNADVILGNALLLGSSLAWAVTILHLRIHRFALSPLELAPWQGLVGLAILVPAAAAIDGGKPVDWQPELFLLIAYAGPLAMGFTVWGSVVVGRALPAIVASLGYLATPVVGMLSAALLMGEPLTATNVGGLVLIVGGLGLVAAAEARLRVRA